MKRLNKKGFTLVELLAVIVILAIVVGITLVTVLPTLKKSRQEAFELTAQTAADYLEKQYQLTLIGNLSGETLEITSVPTSARKITEAEFIKAGLKPENYILDQSTWHINTSTSRACVVLKAKTGTGNTGGEYYDVNPDTASSTGCR